MTFNGATILVTGGTRGIGRATALRLARGGARVVCWYHADEEAAAGLRAEAAQVTIARVAVEDHAAVREGVRQIIADHGRLDGLVHNAGITEDALLAGMSDETWRRVLATNLDGAFHVCREVVREMIYRRAGRIVTVASLSGVTGLPAQANYAAAKGGVIALTKALALEVARYGILVNAVSPGLVDSALTRRLPPDRLAALRERIPLQRLGQPEEIAELAAFLVSGRNTYLTGQNIIICGGLYT